MHLVSVMFVMGSSKRGLHSLRELWSFNQATSQLGTTLVTLMRRTKTWSLLLRHLKKCCFLIQTIRWRGLGGMRWRIVYRCTKELFLLNQRRDDLCDLHCIYVLALSHSDLEFWSIIQRVCLSLFLMRTNSQRWELGSAWLGWTEGHVFFWGCHWMLDYKFASTPLFKAYKLHVVTLLLLH